VIAERLARLRQLLRPDPRRPARVWMRRQWPALLAMGLAVVGVVVFDAWVATCGFAGCPSAGDIRAFRPGEGGRILDRTGALLGRVKQVRRVNVPLAQVPVHVRQAFIATEDRRFYRHDGTDWRGFARSVVANVRSMGVREGFSTITMQVARNTFVARRVGERTLRHKLIELRVARLLESHLTKDQILELYLNVIYLGNGMYGVEAASRDLFGRPVSQVTLAQGAVLAALPKGPSVYTPRRDRRRATERRNLVLTLMMREGYLPRDRAQAAASQPLLIMKDEWHPSQQDDSYALDAVRTLVDSVLHERGMEGSEVIVHTTLDLRAQRAADAAVRRRAEAIEREAGRRRRVSGALVAVDPRTGDIRALVGGARYERGGFNRALAARRQPGSAFKPFVYAAALAAGYTPASAVDDDPVEIRQGRKVWTPANYGDEYQGRTTFRRALMKSANAATVRISRAVGEAQVLAAARRNGIRSPIDPVPAIALGAVEVTPLELATAYAPFANGGKRVTPRLVRRIETPDGTPLWSRESAAPVLVMDARDAWQLTSMLRSVVDEGTGHAVRDWGVDGEVAGKTGTTNDGNDVWFVGYTPTVVTAVWFGYDQPEALPGGASGGRLAAPAWAEWYRNGWREQAPEGAWAPPAGMTSREVDPLNGMLANQWCPDRRTEWFKPGTEPTAECSDHWEGQGWDNPFQIDSTDDWFERTGKKLGKNIRKIFTF
jgi:1A family penicillin-binding protein